MVRLDYNFPKTKAKSFEDPITVGTSTTKLFYKYDALLCQHFFSIDNNGVKLANLTPKAFLPLNYSAKNIHNYLIVPISKNGCNPIGEAFEFEDGFFKLIVCDIDGYRDLLKDYL